MSRLAPTALSIALVAVISLAAHAEVWLVAVTVAVVQVLVAAAPPPADARGRSVRTPKVAATVAAATVATVVTVRPSVLVGAEGSVSGSSGGVASGTLAGILPAVAVGVMLALVSQMLRSDGRRDLVSSTGYAVTLTMFASLSVGWISAVQAVNGPEVVVIGAAAVAASLLTWTVPLDRWICGSLAITAGGAGGAAAAIVLDSSLTPVFGVTVGLAVGLFAVLGQVLGRAWAKARRHAAAGWGFPGALSVALTAPVVHVGGQLVTAF
ncbi:hypothetical protein HMPREF0063_11474 [Aeromicrobium marinum DSM 15272]|uniref:Prepilin type IV endopeptidase peptidase domain-containing protein n=1 Tax=Aeromicrobium marinum DSM 15272 TaxID=585531 RepID=E2SBR5_9ACTN|nr:hypothetical protein [Aeromicrobium marinum]EFQ83201.1 hypothetical protein HMPREF0063_11474 [Aeromicrobium marinum DSM 15272]